MAKWTKELRVPIGRHVECDACGTIYTDDDASGGFIFGGWAYGPCCAEDSLVSIRDHGEERYLGPSCPPGVSFADWIRGLRAKTPDGDAIVVRSS